MNINSAMKQMIDISYINGVNDGVQGSFEQLYRLLSGEDVFSTKYPIMGDIPSRGVGGEIEVRAETKGGEVLGYLMVTHKDDNSG